MSEIADRYRRRADIFERKVAAVAPEAWDHPSPCAEWRARDVVGHIVDMHGVMLRPLGRSLTPAPSVQVDPLAAFRAARADVEAILDDFALAGIEVQTPGGSMTFEEHVDAVVSADLVIHGWDLAKATGQDGTINPAEVDAMWRGAQRIPPEMRIPDHFGPGITVYGPEVDVPNGASKHDRLLGLLGRDPYC